MKWLANRLGRKYCLNRSKDGDICTREKSHNGFCVNHKANRAWNKIEPDKSWERGH